MKKLFTLCIGLLFAFPAFSQTKEGFHLSASVLALDLTGRHLNSFLYDVDQQNINLSLEAGWVGKVIGLSATVQSDFDLDDAALIGLKVSTGIARVSNLALRGGLQVQSEIENFDRFIYTPSVSASAPLSTNFSGKVAALGTFFSDHFNSPKLGLSFGIDYSF